MAAVRTGLVAFASSLMAFVLTSASGCGTSANSVEDCRRIETARCQAAVACGIITDVDECTRFYRDQCLHGLPGEDAPPNLELDRCVQTIERAGQCAGQGAETALADCEPPPTMGSTLMTACDIVRAPERTPECDFLNEEPLEPDAGSPPEDSGTADTGSDDAASE